MRRNYFINSSVTAEQLSRLMNHINAGDIKGDHLEAFMNRKNPFEPRKSDEGLDSQTQLARWKEFLDAIFHTNLDLTTVRIPEQRPEFDRLIVVPPGISWQNVLDACAERFAVDIHEADFSSGEVADERTSDGVYAVWISSFIGIDLDFAGLSANEIAQRKIAGITLRERLLLELKYFTETGEHLDEGSKTLCTGSWIDVQSTRRVPEVQWQGNSDAGLLKMMVNIVHEKEEVEDGGTRQVIA